MTKKLARLVCIVLIIAMAACSVSCDLMNSFAKVTKAELNENGELILTYDNGNTSNLGEVTVEGYNGGSQNGIGIRNTCVNAKGELIITLTNGQSFNVGHVENVEREEISVSEVALEPDGSVTVTLSDGSKHTLSNVGEGDKKSAYELYKEKFGYDGSEEEWMNDLLNGSIVLEKKYNVRFFADGHLLFTKKVEKGALVTPPSLGVEDGYVLTGWKLYNGTPWDFDTDTVQGDIDLYAVIVKDDTLADVLPPTMNLNRDMSILAGYLYYDEWVVRDDGDLVNTELFHRVTRAEKALNIELEIDTVNGTDHSAFRSEVAKRQESTDPNMIVDLVSSYSQLAGAFTLEGRYRDISVGDHINFYSPWWPDKMVEQSSIDDKVYFVLGDISPTLIYETFVILYNNDLIDRYNLEDPMALAKDYQWTLDKMIEMTSGIYDDADNSKTVTIDDLLAFNINDAAHNKAFPFGMGVRVIETDEDKGYVWSDTYIVADVDKKMDTIVGKFNKWLDENNGVTTRNKTGYSDYGYSFKNGNCIFNASSIAYASFNLSNYGINYGFVPIPLFDSNQKQYYSYYGNPTSVWGVPTNAPDIDDSSALLEYLGGDAYNYITPVIFERAFRCKYSKGVKDDFSLMYDIVRKGYVIDPCMFYNTSISSGNYIQFSDIDGNHVWSTKFNTFRIRAMENELKEIVDKLRSLEY